MYRGTGVHHVGLGVKDLARSREFYREVLGFTQVWEEFPDIWNAMPEMYRGSEHNFEGIMFGQASGGIVLELIRKTLPLPRPIWKAPRYGDLGVGKVAIAVGDVDRFFDANRDRLTLCSSPKAAQVPGLGEHRFVYGLDPDGNLIEFFSGDGAKGVQGFGGVRWAGVSVSDLERSVDFYRRRMGFDELVAEPHEAFSGLVDEVAGAPGARVRSCLLANRAGGGMLELFELLRPRGRSMPFNTQWGDFGYLEVALLCEDIFDTFRELSGEGVEFLSRPAVAELEDAEGWFLYARDPDGVPVEVISVVPRR